MVDEVLARAPLLAVVGGRREPERAAQALAVDVRVVGGNFCEQLVDEALISLVKLENSHRTVSLLRASGRNCPRNGDAGTPVVTMKWTCPCSGDGVRKESSWSSPGCSPSWTRTPRRARRPRGER